MEVPLTDEIKEKEGFELQMIFKLTRKGFSENLRVGEVFEYKNERYILTHIMETKRLYGSSAYMEVKVIAQLVGSKSKYNLYEKVSGFVNKYPKGEFNKENPLYKIKDIFADADGVCGEITSIESIKYEFVDLVVTYRTRLIRPWSEQEMNQAIKEDRLSKFTVIG